MDFQGRLNSYRQGLQEQQDTFDRASSNMSQFGRSIIPDKVAQHYEYMEKVGGLTTGTAAAIHGGVGIGKRIAARRAAKSAQNTPSTLGDNARKAQSGEQDSSSKDTLQEQKSTEGTGPNTGEKESSNPFDSPSDLASSAEGEAKGGKLGNLARDVDDEDEGSYIANKNPITGRTGNKEGLSNMRQTTDETPDLGATNDNMMNRFGKSADKKSAEIDEDAIRPAPAIASEDIELARPKPNFEEDDDDTPLSLQQPKSLSSNMPAADEIGNSTKDFSEIGDSAYSAASKAAEGASEGASTMFSDAAGAVKSGLSQVSDFVSAGKEAIGQGIKSAGSAIAGEAGEAIGAAALDVVPVLGEVAGLGMLISSIIKGHKHEENAPPPELTSSTAEATEQSGGFNTDMLKGASSSMIT